MAKRKDEKPKGTMHDPTHDGELEPMHAERERRQREAEKLATPLPNGKAWDHVKKGPRR